MNKSKPQQRARRASNRREITVTLKQVPHTPESAARAYAVVGKSIARAIKKLHTRAADVQIAHHDGEITGLQAAGMVARNVGLAARGRLA